MNSKPQPPDRNLALELVRVTEVAALSAARWMGRGDKNGADNAAVEAMRAVLHSVQMDGIVVIGEGEKDEAPMLYNGEKIGDGSAPQVDIAVDPIDGTTPTAMGRGGALSVIAVAERGTMFNPVSDEPNSGTCGSDLGDEVFVPVAIQNHGRQVTNTDALGFGDSGQILSGAKVQIYYSYAFRANGDLLHVEAGARVEHGATLRHGDDGKRTPSAHGGWRGSVNRIDGDIDLRG